MVLGEKPERLLSILTDQIELLTGARPGLETIIAAGKVGGQSLVVKWINLTLFIFSFTLRSFQAFCIHGAVAHSFRYVFWTVTYYASLSISCKGRLYTQTPIARAIEPMTAAPRGFLISNSLIILSTLCCPAEHKLSTHQLWHSPRDGAR